MVCFFTHDVDLHLHAPGPQGCRSLVLLVLLLLGRCVCPCFPPTCSEARGYSCLSASALAQAGRDLTMDLDQTLI